MGDPAKPVILSDSISAEPALGLRIATTMPDELLRHNISDEELQALVDMRRDYLWEGMWVALGIALASSPTAITFLVNYFSNDNLIAISPSDLFHVIVLFVSSAIFGVLCYVTRGKSKSAQELARKIRERTKRYGTGS